MGYDINTEFVHRWCSGRDGVESTEIAVDFRDCADHNVAFWDSANAGRSLTGYGSVVVWYLSKKSSDGYGGTFCEDDVQLAVEKAMEKKVISTKLDPDAVAARIKLLVGARVTTADYPDTPR